jgi:hypothetical protein
MAQTLIVGSQETGRTGILPVWGVHRQDAYAPSDVHLLVAPEYAYLSAIRERQGFRLCLWGAVPFPVSSFQPVQRESGVVRNTACHRTPNFSVSFRVFRGQKTILRMDVFLTQSMGCDILPK